MDVAIAIGMYISDKNKGAFKDVILTFSETPKIEVLKGTIAQKYDQLKRAEWGRNTNFEKSLELILDVAIQNKVRDRDMPRYLLCASDMQFDRATEAGFRGFDVIKDKYRKAGYEMPNVIFWNLHAYDNAPVKMDEQGVALISGFSPAILKSVLAADSFNPMGVMLKAIMVDRYSY
jgi:hypothetical protein